MEVEESDVVMLVLDTRLDDAVGAQQIGFEEGRNVDGVWEQVDGRFSEEVGKIGARRSQNLLESYLLGAHEINFLIEGTINKIKSFCTFGTSEPGV